MSTHQRARVALATSSSIILTTLAAAGLFACHDTPTAPSLDRAHPRSALVVPGDSTAPDVAFLPPLGSRHQPRGEIDTTLAPSVSICRLAATTAGSACSADTVARFASDTALADSLRVTLAAQSYLARWRTGTITPDTGTAYRITVALGDTTVGATDLKIVPDGYVPTADDSARFSTLAPRQFLDVRFQIFLPADTLIVVTDAGVSGTPAAGITTAHRGTRIPYRFQAVSGYTNLSVTLDDQFVSPAGQLTMRGTRVLVASADRRAAVASGDQWILQGAAALARAPTAAGAQRLLDQLDAMTDTARLDARLREVEYALIERESPTALHAFGSALDSALAGRVLHVGDGAGTGDDSGGGVLPPPDTSGGGGITMTTRLAPGTPSLRIPSPFALGNTPTTASPVGGPTVAPMRDLGAPVTSGGWIAPEPVTIAFVNGVLTTPFGALFGANAVARAARSAPWGAQVPFDVRLVYNRSNTGRSVMDDCVRDIAAISWAIGTNSIIQRLSHCAALPVAEVTGILGDFSEAGGQVASLLANSPTTRPADADSVAAAASRWRALGRHVLFVPHSQGNLMVQQGVALMAHDGRYCPATDTTCIGAVALASPTSANWPMASQHVSGLVVEGDAILMLGQNHFPQVHTDLDDSAAVEVGEALRRHARGVAGARRLAWAVRLHSLVDSYLRREPIHTRVQEEMVRTYRSCALGSVAVAPSPLHLRAGIGATLHAAMRDLNGAPLDGTRGVAWSIPGAAGATPSVAIRADGSVQTLATGSATVRATTRSRYGDGTVIVDPAPLAATVNEVLSGFWSTVQGMSVPPVNGDTTTTYPGEQSAGWGPCGERKWFMRSGWSALYSRTCVAHYDVTVFGIPDAARVVATFFAVGSHSPITTVARWSTKVSLELSGPMPTLDDLPGPPLVDRVNVSVYDGFGRLLRSGTACAHGCTGWDDMP